ncbi:MAG TPA: Asp-tRNA(Asn)/Glu-tRNA(Gln) amidotransferase subunit GatC [Candidatus Methylacidiphilales bacterium]
MAEPSIDVSYVAHLARLQLSPEETALFQKQLGDILSHVADLQKADVSGVAPIEDAPDFRNNLRDDVERPSFTAAEALANAPQSANDLIVVPRMVD